MLPSHPSISSTQTNSNKFITKEKNVIILDFKQYNKFTKMSHSSKLNENSKATNAEIQAKTANSSEMNANKVSAEDATNEFFGYFVQLDCGDDGKYQGFITEVQPATDGTSAWGKVKLEKPLRNGDPFGSEDMAIMVPGELIQEIKVLYMPEASTEKTNPVKTLPQKSKSNLTAGFQPVKKVPQYTPKTSSTSLNNKSNPSSKFTNVHHPTPFNLLSRNSPSNISVSRRPPSVAQSLLKMKPPAVHDAQILSNIKNKEPQMRANAKPFVPRSILVRPKKILSITPPPNKEATTSKKAAEEVMAKSEEEKKEGKKERGEKKQKTSKKESNKPTEAGDETKPKEKKKPKRSTKEKGAVDNVENGEERVKKPKKKKSIAEEGEGSSKMKGGKDERNRLAKEKRANKNTDEKVRKKKDKEEKKDETVIKETEQLKNKEEEEEKPTEESASMKKEEEPPLNEKSQIEEEINKVEENYVEKIAEEIYGNNKLEEDEMLVTEEELRNEVAEILENVSTGLGNMTIENIDDLNEAAEIQTNTSSSTLANRTMTSSNEEFDEDDEEPARPEEYTGKLASINTDVGLYQGIVAAVDPINRTVKLEKPLLDGYPLGAKFIELVCSAMKNITIFGNGNGSNSNSCYATPNRNVREWNGRKGGRRSYSPSSAANNNRPYSPNVNQQNAPQQSPPKPRDQQPFPLNAATMSNQQVFMRSMPQPPVDHQRQSMDYQQHQQLATTVQSPISDGKRRNFGNGKNNNRQSPTRPAAEWSHHRQSPRTFIRRSVPPTSSTPPAQLAHEEYGDYKKFIQPQVPTPPVRPRTNNINNANNNNSSRHCGPTGIPAMDCMNGYSDVLNSEESTILGAPLDHAALNVDFDFASNLALFDKKEFAKKTEHTFYGLNTGGNNSRNYRNDENVLIDPSRVTSWVSTPSTSNSNWLYGQPNIANAAGQTGRDNHHRMQQQYSRSKPSTKTD